MYIEFIIVQNGEDKRYDIQTPDDIYSLREELIKGYVTTNS